MNRHLRPAPVVRVAQAAVLLVAAGSIWTSFRIPAPASTAGWFVLVLIGALGPALAIAAVMTRLESRDDRVFVRVIGRRFDIRHDEVLSVETDGPDPVLRTARGIPEGWRLIHPSDRPRIADDVRRALARRAPTADRGPDGT